MQQADSESRTIITVDFNVDTLDKAESLGVNLSEMANKMLLADVKRLQQQPGDHESHIAPRP